MSKTPDPATGWSGPDPLEIPPLAGRLTPALVRVPGSKSETNRVLPLAAVAHGASHLINVLDSEDTQMMRQALTKLGVGWQHDPRERSMRIQGSGGPFPVGEADLFLANSGTSLRFLTAMVSPGKGVYRLDGIPRMRERPIGDLLRALGQLDVQAKGERDDEYPPVTITTEGWLPGREPDETAQVTLAGSVSSQFLSGLLMAAPLCSRPVRIQIEGELVSRPYIALTLHCIEQFGVSIVQEGDDAFFCDGRRPYQAAQYVIEPDASAASYFFALAAITGGTVTVADLNQHCRQGDWKFVRVLEQMGCTIETGPHGTSVHGGTLRGVEADLGPISDTVPTLAAVACFAEGPTSINNVAHIRHKETDRIHAVVTELRKAGLQVDERDDGLTIHPGPIQPTTFATYNDHRMAMSFALLGVKWPGVKIADPGCIGKTYPEYFDDLFEVLQAPSR